VVHSGVDQAIDLSLQHCLQGGLFHLVVAFGVDVHQHMTGFPRRLLSSADHRTGKGGGRDFV
jgi:hypothetical protein